MSDKLKIFDLHKIFLGTPPRLERSTINFENLGYVEADDPSIPFSFLNERVWIEVKRILSSVF